MGVYFGPELIDADALAGFVITAKTCFYCGESLGSPPIVYWGGYSDDSGPEVLLALHKGCAISLGSHLVKDGLLTPFDRRRCG